jgi:alkylation response protein AidB-like acyl-CoA dehydrogenase
MGLDAYERAVRLTQERALAARAAKGPGAEGSGFKLHGAVAFKQRVNLLLDAQGPRGMLSGAVGHVEFLTAPSMSIRGGTDEIQRNIVGERVLGLPSEPRVDRDVPWSVSRRAGATTT